jgi:uncharacterized protein
VPNCHERIRQLIAGLRLVEHPEGGHYAEVYRSASRVQPEDDRSPRPALTSIYFLLPAGAVSRWHRVLSDEVWHFYEGAPLDLWTAPPDAGAATPHRLGPLADGQMPGVYCPGRLVAGSALGGRIQSGGLYGRSRVRVPGFRARGGSPRARRDLSSPRWGLCRAPLGARRY